MASFLLFAGNSDNIVTVKFIIPRIFRFFHPDRQKNMNNPARAATAVPDQFITNRVPKTSLVQNLNDHQG